MGKAYIACTEEQLTTTGLDSSVILYGNTVSIKKGNKTVKSVSGSYKPKITLYFESTSSNDDMVVIEDISNFTTCGWSLMSYDETRCGFRIDCDGSNIVESGSATAENNSGSFSLISDTFQKTTAMRVKIWFGGINIYLS